MSISLFCSWISTKVWAQPTDLDQRNRDLVLAVAEHRACPLSCLNETSGLSVSVRWRGGRGPEQNGSGTATRSESLGNLERRRREVPEGHAPERDDVKRGERARRRKLKRRVRHADVGFVCLDQNPNGLLFNIVLVFFDRENG